MIYNIWQNLDSSELNQYSMTKINDFLIPTDIPYKYMLENKVGFLNIHFYYLVDSMGFKKELEDLNIESIFLKYRKNNRKVNMISIKISNYNNGNFNLDDELTKIIKILNKEKNKNVIKNKISNFLFLEQFIKYISDKLNNN